ncbi:MAG TPA: DUF6113 family protein [Jatrophihabitans sp.]|jgi:hypothetical protein|nr:DUF6113 family protein [Jatrophihabitans sp.]
MSRSDRPGSVADAPARPPAGLLVLGYLLFAAAGAMTAVVEVLLVPSRIGQTLVPLAPLLAVVSNVALPAISRGLTDTMVSAVPPVAGWLVTTFVLAGARPEGDVLLPAGDAAYISYSLLGFGTLAGLVTIWRSNRPGAWTGRWPSSRLARSGSDNGGAR